MTDVLSPDAGAPALRLSTPGDLIAAVPVLIGFHPRESLVVISTGCPVGGRIGLTLRVDLPPPEHREDLAAMVVETVTTAGDSGPPGGAVVLVVAAPGPLGVPPGRVLAGLVATGLRERGITTDSVLWAAGTRGGEPWRCYEPCACTGTVADPNTSVVMAHAVAEGRVVEAAREDLAARLAPSDPAAIRRREALLREGDPLPADPAACVADAVAAFSRIVAEPGGRPACTAPAAARPTGAEPTGAEPTEARPASGGSADAGLSDAGSSDAGPATGGSADAGSSGAGSSGAGRGGAGPTAAGAGSPYLDDRAAVTLVAALGTAEGRDAALRLTCGLAARPRAAPVEAGTVETLWATLAREVPDPEAAEPAALLALAALLRGDGAYALVALDRAERAWPGHRLTRLVDGLVASGISPARLRAWLGPGT